AAEQLQCDRSDNHANAERIVDKSLDMCSTGEQERAGESRRKQCQNPSRQAAVRRNDADLTFHSKPLANHASKIVQDFGKVAARLALRQNSCGKELSVENGNARREIAQGVWKRHPEVLLLVKQPEFAADWLRCLVRHH